MSYNDSQSIYDIIKRLNDDASVKLVAESYPDNPADYSLIHPVGVVLVGYQGSKYSDGASGVKNRDISIVTTVLLRELRASKEAEKQLETIITSLSGYKAETWRSGLDIESDIFRKQSDGVWQYDIIFKLPTLLITQQVC